MYKRQLGRFAWSALYSAVLQKDMFSNVFVTQPAGRARDMRSGIVPANDAQATSQAGAPYQIWHVSEGLERLLGFSEQKLIGKDANVFRAKGQAPPPLLDQVSAFLQPDAERLLLGSAGPMHSTNSPPS